MFVCNFELESIWQMDAGIYFLNNNSYDYEK